jgi:putative transposase
MSPKRLHKNTRRLVGFNYQTPRSYAIVLNSADRMHIFGEVVDATMQPSKIGQVVIDRWVQIPQIAPDVVLDVYQLMPDHFHAIVRLTKEPTNNVRPPRQNNNKKSAAAQCLLPHSLSTLIASFKRGVTVAVRNMYDDKTYVVWQANYYDSIIRSDRHLHNVRAYILHNPQEWQEKYSKKPGVMQ